MPGPRRARSRTQERDRPNGTARDRALRLLAVRWRSRDELTRRLRRAGFEAEEVAQAIEGLESAGLVDDERFARELVRSHAQARLSGSRAIREALRQKGVDPEVAEAALELAGDEEERAVALASRRMARMRGLAEDVAARRVFGLLVRRGFGAGVAEAAVRAALDGLARGEETSNDQSEAMGGGGLQATPGRRTL